MPDSTPKIVTDHEFAYETRRLYRDTGNGQVAIGTLFMFHDEPLQVGRDQSGNAPDCVFLRYEVGGPWVVEEVGHPVVKCTADDDPVPITQAVAFNARASGKEVADWWERFHAV